MLRETFLRPGRDPPPGNGPSSVASLAAPSPVGVRAKYPLEELLGLHNKLKTSASGNRQWSHCKKLGSLPIFSPLHLREARETGSAYDFQMSHASSRYALDRINMRSKLQGAIARLIAKGPTALRQA